MPAAGPVATAPGELSDRLHRLMSRYKRHLHAAVRDAGDGLAPMEARALDYFARHAPATQSELAAHAGRDKAQVARLVAGLLQRGLLQAAPDPTDGRSQRLSLTPAGRAMQRTMKQHRLRFEAGLLAALDAYERSLLLALLDRLLAAGDAP